MDRTVDIFLITEKLEYDDSRRPVRTREHKRRVFAQMNSITRAEWFEAGRNGMQPTIMFVVSVLDYRNEKLIEWKGKRYGIYRTFYGRNDNVELYCEEKGGEPQWHPDIPELNSVN